MDQGMIESMGRLEDRHWWFVARREILIAAARRELATPPTAILDLGCGTGGNLSAFVDAFAPGRAVGLDNSPLCIAACESRGLQVVPGDLTALPFGDAEFDLVTAFDVIEHVDDDAKATSEIARVLKPGGLALVTVPAYEWLYGPHDELNDHKRRYTSARLTSSLEAGDLDVETTSYLNTLLFPVALVGRITEKATRTHLAEEQLPPRPINWTLYHVFRIERHLLSAGIRLPFGVSVLASARRPGETSAE